MFSTFFARFTAVCSFLSKENSAVLPVALALTDIWFFDSAWLKKAWAVCRKTGWKVRAAAAAALLSSSFYAFTVVLPKLLSGYAHRDFNLVERLLTEGRVVVWYMSLLLWPDPARLSMEHEFEISTSLFSPLTTLPALLLIAALIFLAIRFRKRFPVITYGIAWFFLNLVIESTIIPLELVFEHRLYLPSMGFYLSGCGAFCDSFPAGRQTALRSRICKGRLLAASIGAACLALLTFIRNGVWENKVTIHYDAVDKSARQPTGKRRLRQHALRGRPVRGSYKICRESNRTREKRARGRIPGPERHNHSPYKTGENRRSDRTRRRVCRRKWRVTSKQTPFPIFA